MSSKLSNFLGITPDDISAAELQNMKKQVVEQYEKYATSGKTTIIWGAVLSFIAFLMMVCSDSHEATNFLGDTYTQHSASFYLSFLFWLPGIICLIGGYSVYSSYNQKAVEISNMNDADFLKYIRKNDMIKAAKDGAKLINNLYKIFG